MKQKKFLFTLLLALFFIAPSVQGAEMRYFEFAPDISGTSLIGSTAVYQYVKPYDDYISGFDVWVSNTGSSGSASFSLRAQNDMVLATKSVTIPNAPPVWGGTFVHVALPSSVHVSSTETYKIRMTTSMPSLRLYTVDLTQLRPHDSGEPIPPQVLPAYVGTTEQRYAYKFALYEDNDTASPILSDFVLSLASPQLMNLSFRANEPVDRRVLYGLTGQALDSEIPFTNLYRLCPPGGVVCTLSIPTIPNTGYSYRFTARDAWGNETVQEGSFISSAEWFASSSTSPAIPPQPSSTITIINPRAEQITEHSATIVWTTDVPGNSSALLSIRDYLGFRAIASFGDSTLELEHALPTGMILIPNTQYFVSLTSFDSGGNYSGANIEFVTLGGAIAPPPPVNPPPQNPPPQSPPQAPLPQPSSTPSTIPDPTIPPPTSPAVIVTPSTNEGGSGVVLQWSVPSTGAPSGGYRIDVFDMGNVLRGQFFSTSPDVTLSSLPAGDYRAVVYADEGGIFTKVALPAPITVAAPYTKPASAWDNLTLYLSLFIGIIGAFLVIFFVQRLLRRRGGLKG